MHALQISCDAAIGPLRLQIDESFDAAWTVIFGPSGSGKSSLLRLICGLWSPPASLVLLDGQDLSHMPAYRRNIGLVAQQPALFPHLTVRQNILFGAPGERPRSKADLILQEHHLSHVAKAYPATLSGGERQRVALARALMHQPRLLLLDEVFTGLQTPLRDEMIGLLRKAQQSAAASQKVMPIVSVTHDVAEALICADEVLRLGDGRVVARGTPAEVLAAERDALLRQLREP